MTARLGDKDKNSKPNSPSNSSNNGQNPSHNSNAENRRANKPLMEKRRRARINQSLALLKTIVVDSNKVEGGHKHAKLEKADILELTVKHLQDLHRQQERRIQDVVTNNNAPALSQTGATLANFQQGYQECAKEVVNFLSAANADPTIASRLLEHLQGFQRELQRPLTLTHSYDSDDVSMTTPLSPLSLVRTHSTSPSPCPSVNSPSPQQLDSHAIPSSNLWAQSRNHRANLCPTPAMETETEDDRINAWRRVEAEPQLAVKFSREDSEPLDFRKAMPQQEKANFGIGVHPDGALNLCKRNIGIDEVWRPW